MKKIQFKPLSEEDQKLAKTYAKRLGYRSVLDNDKRKNVIITDRGVVFLVIRTNKHLCCYKNGLFIPITQNGISEIERFKKRFKHININERIIQMIFGLSLFFIK